MLFHPTEHSLRVWGDLTPNPGVALESVVSLGTDGLMFDSKVVEGRLIDAGFDAPKPKPPKKRNQRAGKIEALTQELRQFLRDAHEHALATRDLPKPPPPLPRPTQKELAARCGLTETVVSRCLNDPEAKVLRRYWDAAADINQILAWDGTLIVLHKFL